MHRRWHLGLRFLQHIEAFQAWYHVRCELRKRQVCRCVERVPDLRFGLFDMQRPWVIQLYSLPDICAIFARRCLYRSVPSEALCFFKFDLYCVPFHVHDLQRHLQHRLPKLPRTATKSCTQRRWRVEW